MDDVVSKNKVLNLVMLQKTLNFEPGEIFSYTNTSIFNDHEMIVKNRAYSYYLAGDTYKKSVLNNTLTGMTSLFTTVEDLAKWLDNFDKMTVGGKKAANLIFEKGILNNGEKTNHE